MTFITFAQGAITNLFMLLGFVALFSMIRRWPMTRLSFFPPWINGFLFGGMALLAMLVSMAGPPGLMFDCRSGVIGTGALLGGPVCALTSVLFPCLYRIYIGGLGLGPGLMEIIFPAILGSLCHWIYHRNYQGITIRSAILCSLIVGLGSNGLVIASIIVFMQRQALMLDVSSTLLVFFNGAISMSLFSTLLLLERQHTESMELYSSILQTAREGFLLVNMKGRLCEVNEAYCRMSGYTALELSAMSISDLQVSLPESEISGQIQRILTKGGEIFEAVHRHKDGSTYDVDISAQYLPGQNGRLIYLLRDVSDQKKAQRALQESEKKYKMLIETTNTGFVILDDQGRVLDANQEYVRLTACNRIEDILGRSVTDWTAPYDLERNAKAVCKCLETGSIRNLEIDYLDAKGRIVPIEIHATVLSGELSSVIMTICRDISERREAAEESERLHMQLTHAQKMESIGRLAGGVAHDFNNMLSVILANTEMAFRSLPPHSQWHSYITDIQDAAKRSAELTRQLLAFARRQNITPRVLDLNETVAGMLKMLRRLIGEDIHLLWQPGTNLLPVEMDPSQIDQILANLSVNARDAIGQRAGKISVATSMTTLGKDYCDQHAGCVPGKYAVLTVSDDGCGMSQETLLHIFEPFFTTKSIGKGTGLGLATIYGIVEQNKGLIDVQSELGKGTTFRIFLPCLAEPAVEMPGKAERAATPLHGEQTILLVEDERALLNILKRILEKEGYSVLAATTPVEALRMTREYSGKINLLISDVIMPEMNGYDLSKQLLSLQPGLKRFLMSGYTPDIITDYHVREEDVDFIQKPFSLDVFIARIRTLLAS
jgi:two-component system, cell cycle sensor histidine kinase and response regulator CckA